MSRRLRIGVLALQGAVRPHAEMLRALDVDVVEVRLPRHLDGIDGLVVPGGESTAVSRLLDGAGLTDPLRRRLADGLPTLGTCAGMILLSRRILDGRADQHALDAIDLTVRRNAFGRQIDSFEAALDVDGFAEPFLGVFIRAPFVEEAGEGVEVLASVDGHPVLCRQGRVLVSSFHPELTDDRRIHGLLVDLCRDSVSHPVPGPMPDAS